MKARENGQTGYPTAGGPRWHHLRANLPAVTVMLLAVLLQLLGAMLLKTIADHRVTWSMALLIVAVGGVLILNLLRLGVWGYANSRFPLSTTFPLASLFFPGLLVVAMAFGDEIGANQVIGAGLITFGTIWLSATVSS